MCWASRGRPMAVCSRRQVRDNAVKSWSIDSGEQKKSIPGFGKEVTALAFVGATTDVIASSGDKTVRMFKADTGQAGKQFTGATDYPRILALYRPTAKPSPREAKTASSASGTSQSTRN